MNIDWKRVRNGSGLFSTSKEASANNEGWKFYLWDKKSKKNVKGKDNCHGKNSNKDKNLNSIRNNDTDKSRDRQNKEIDQPEMAISNDTANGSDISVESAIEKVANRKAKASGQPLRSGDKKKDDKLYKKKAKACQKQKSAISEDQDKMMKMYVSQEENDFTDVETDSDEEETDETERLNRSKEIDLTFIREAFDLGMRWNVFCCCLRMIVFWRNLNREGSH